MNLHKWINELLSIHFSPNHKKCFTAIDNILEINFEIFSFVREKLLKFSDLFQDYSEIIHYNGINTIYPQRTFINFDLFKGFMPKNKEINFI